MKRSVYLLLFLLCFSSVMKSQTTNSKALILIDIQDFYFPGGAMELVGAEEAAQKAKTVLNWCRDEEYQIIHVKHKVNAGGDIHESVRPLMGETVIEKTEVNAFKDTNLNAVLNAGKVSELIIVGMQTHMCLEAAVRAACDADYKVIVIDEACATRDLESNGTVIKAKDVHISTLITLNSYAEVISFEVFNEKFLN